MAKTSKCLGFVTGMTADTACLFVPISISGAVAFTLVSDSFEP